MNASDRARGWENLQKGWYFGAGAFGIPKMRACRQAEVTDWVGFDACARVPRDRRSRTGVHFWLFDGRFERLWRAPDRYLPMLLEFGAVCQPDFSIYTDFPEALRIYNVYRNAWLGCYLQDRGVNVVPTLLWADAAADRYCWDGYPETGIFAVSTVGSMRRDRQEGFVRGWQEMQERLTPSQVLVYGQLPAGCTGRIRRIEPFTAQLRRRAEKEGQWQRRTEAVSGAGPERAGT